MVLAYSKRLRSHFIQGTYSGQLVDYDSFWSLIVRMARCSEINLQCSSGKSSLHGRSNDGFRCRKKETLEHVIGFCSQGELLRNTRHNNIRAFLAKELRLKGLEVFEEVQCTGDNDSIRRKDIIAINKHSKTAFILDQTIRFEKSDGQPEEVDEEKKKIYEPTIRYFLNKCKLHQIEVIGLMIGARGTIPKFFVQFYKRFKLSSKCIDNVAIMASKVSVTIFRNHLYGERRNEFNKK